MPMPSISEIGKALATAQEELAAQRAEREHAEAERDGQLLVFGWRRNASSTTTVTWEDRDEAKPAPATSEASKQPRRRGRPPKEASSEIVEWWTPGWQKKYR